MLSESQSPATLPAAPAPAAPAPLPKKHDPYADLATSYAEDIAHTGERDYGDPGPGGRQTPKTPLGELDDAAPQDPIPGLSSGYGYHIEGDHRYE